MTVRVIEGDCLATLRTLPAGIAQTCVTSPPYYGLRDYGVEGQIGLEDTPDAYVARLVAVFREVKRVLRDDGTAWLNLGDSYASATKCSGGLNSKQPSNAGSLYEARKVGMGDAKEKDLLMIPAQVALALRGDGWWLRKDIIWHKPNPMPESVRDRPTSAHEHVFLLAKRAAYYYDAEAIAEPLESEPHALGNKPRPAGQGQRFDDGRATAIWGNNGTRNARDVWTIATQPYSGAHFATMPPDLAERCIKAGSSERGQCPHCAAPWVRQVGQPTVSGRRDSGGEVGGADAGMYSGRAGSSARPTLGWSPSCDCPSHQPVPQVVLDPFGGAGTTGLVADRLCRSAIICELNPEYARLARARLTDDAPLLAVVA